MEREPITSDFLLSLPKAAQRLDISVRALYRLMARGEMPPPVKVGGASKLYVSDLDAYLARLREERDRKYRNTMS